MIIECDQCNTKFRLDDSRISPNGVKVRCTKCQNVFIVTPPPPEEVQVDEVFGTEKPFSEKPRESFDPAGAGAEQDDSSAWGVFNSDAGKDEETSEESEGTGDEDAPEERDSGAGQNLDAQATDDENDENIEDGSQEAPDLSFGGPDFSAIPGLTGQADATEEESAEEESSEEDETDGPWFEGVAEQDDGFPEDGPEETPASGETPIAGDIPSGDETAATAPASPTSDEEDVPDNEPREEEEGEEQAQSNGFDVSAGQEEEEEAEGEAEKTPFDKFDFGVDDEQEQGEGAQQEQADDDWGVASEEEEAPEKPIIKDEEPENPIYSPEEDEPEEDEPEDTGEGFSLTPPAPAEPPAKQSESAGADKVIPFSSGYGRNGKAAKAGAAEENRFEDLFSRTLSEQEAGAAEASAAAPDEDEELEFDKDALPPETDAEVAEEGPAQKPAAGMGVLIAVIIFILGAGAIYFSGVIDNMARTLTATAPADAVEIEAISGYIAENKNFGRYFVIEAKIKNASNEAQSIDRITGVIYDDRGKSIATRSVSPGRVVSEDDLKNLTKGELLAQFSDSSGGMIPPKGTVPVMVPFTEMPAGMAEYGLKIIRE